MKRMRSLTNWDLIKNRRIFLLLLRSFLSAFFPGMAFVTVYMIRNLGLSMTQVMVLQSVYMLSVTMFEVPTGIIGDKYSRKLSIILGLILFMFGWSIYLFSLPFGFYIVAEIIMGMARSLGSGSDEALQYDTFKELKLEDYYQRFTSLLRISILLSFLLGGVFGMVVYPLIGLRGIWLVSLITSPLELLALVLIREPKIRDQNSLTPNYVWYVKDMLKTFKSDKILLFLVLFSLVVWQARYFVNWGTQPLFLKFNVPVKYYGLILMTVISGLGIGLHSVILRFKKKFSFRWLGIVLLSTIVLFDFGLWLSLKINWLIILTVVVYRMFMTEFGNLLTPLMHPHIRSESRATVLSGLSLIRISYLA